MRKFYYQFKWIILVSEAYFLLEEKFEDIDYDLKRLSVTSEDFIYTNYLLGVDSDEDFLMFKHNIGDKLGIGQWIRVHQPEQEWLDLPDEYDRLNQMSAHNRFKIIDRISWLGQLNRAHLDWLSEDEQYVYFKCEWIPRLSNLEAFRRAYDYSFDKGFLIYWLGHIELGQKCVRKVVGIRMPSLVELNEFISNVGKAADLNEWKPIEQDEFYKGWDFTGFLDKDKTINNVKVYAEKNTSADC